LSTSRPDAFNAKIEKVLGEFKTGKLKTSAGKVVTDRRQAEAIAMSEARAHVQAARKMRRRPRKNTEA
jgi:hypothetical protein